MGNMFSKEYSKIADLCRGIAAFLVIMGHCFLLAENQYGVASWAIDVIYSFHMPLFMLICGYFSYKSYKKYGTRTFLCRRVASFIPPLSVWALLQTMWGIIRGEIQAVSVVQSFLYKFFSNYWFIWAVLVLSCIVVVEDLSNRTVKNLIYIILGITCLITPDEIINSAAIKFMLPYFIIGFKVAQMHININELFAKVCARKGNVFLLNVLFAILCFLWESNWRIDIAEFSLCGRDPINQLSIVMGRFLIGFINSCNVILDVCILHNWLLQNISERKLQIIETPLRWSGKNSMGCYLVHYYVINYILTRALLNVSEYNFFVILCSSIAVWGITAVGIIMIDKVHMRHILLGK